MEFIHIYLHSLGASITNWGEPERDPHDAVYGDFFVMLSVGIYVHIPYILVF